MPDEHVLALPATFKFPGILPRVPTQEVLLPALRRSGVSLYVRREDLLHPAISGNKYRKLKYNILQAREQAHTTLLTFGGAYSNHIAATAKAGSECGFRTIGVIRGDELARHQQLNPTLQMARSNGMQLKFVSRELYRKKDNPSFISTLQEEIGPFYLLPEGGSNALAVKGCEEILDENDHSFDLICCCVGTGGTLAGLINASSESQRVLGFPVLKAGNLKKDICSFVSKSNWELEHAYHFGGYAKINESLVSFINTFRRETGIPLDPVYTGKMFYGILDMVFKNKLAAGTKILAIHSGGLQGIEGMNRVLEQKNLPLIDL